MDQENKASKQRNTFYIGMVALLLVGLVIGILVSNHNRTEQLDQAKIQVAGEVQKLVRNQPGDHQAMGNPNSPVTIIEYSDLRCPYCAKLFLSSENQIKSEYVDTGKARVEWRNYPILGDESVLAAQAAVAAGMQGKFFEFVNQVYSHAPAQGHLEVNDTNLTQFAQAAGVPDIGKFKTDMNSDAAKQSVQKDMDEGQKLGIQGTPTVFVNGILIDNPSYETVSNEVNKQLNQHGLQK